MSKKSSLEDLKTWALQSGFPLENDVHSILRGAITPSMAIEKDVPFESIDGQGRSQLRSIDFKSSVQRTIQVFPRERDSKQLATLNFIIDAKFTLDEDKQRFWFIPSGKSAQDFSFPYLIPQARFLDAYSEPHYGHRKDLVQFALCPSDFRLASIGRKVSELKDGKESLAGYQVQGLEAVAHFIKEDYWSPGKEDRDQSFAPHIYIPIVVSNAPLYILKDSITISEVESAADAADICESIEYLVVETPNIHYVKEALRKVSSSVRDYGGQNLKWKYSELNVAPVVFCNVTALKSLVGNLIQRFNSLPEAAGGKAA